MSHLAKIDIQITNQVALKNACKKLELEIKENYTCRFYDGSIEKGTAVFLNGWKYPVIFDMKGTAKYDNYEGEWGKQSELDKLTQRYGIEVTRIEAKKQGYSLSEKLLSNGFIQVVLQKIS